MRIGRLICAICFVTFVLFPMRVNTPKIKAQEVFIVDQPCNFTYSYDYTNSIRSHGDAYGSGGKAFDLNDECVGSDALASIDGIVTRQYGGYFSCAPLGGITVRNSEIIITADDGRRVRYLHLDFASPYTLNTGDVVKVGDVIGKIGHEGCATGDHIHFEVRDANNQLMTYAQWIFGEIPRVFNTNLTGDYNGDGKNDTVIVEKINDRNFLNVYLSTGSNFVKETWFENEYRTTSDQWIASDFTGDGKTDLARIYPDENGRTDIKMFISNGSLANGGFTKETYWFENEYRTNQDNWSVGDFTGDGKADLARIYPDENGRTDIKMFVSTGSLVNGGFVKETYWFENEYRTDSDLWRTGDFTGDGKADLARIYPDENLRTDIKMFVSTGSLANGGFVKETYWFENEYRTSDDLWKVGDFTGDGKSDLARIYPDENSRTDIKMFVSKGSLVTGGFTKETYWFENEYRTSDDLWIQGDYTGDGKIDLARIYPDENSRTDIKMFVSKGSLVTGGFTKETYWFENEYRLDSDRWFMGDFTGDGKKDLTRIYIENDMDKLKVFISNGSLLNGGFTKLIWY
jgi:murein DD-endopeptidase MepM/ murein hydrolase activator NlpD